MKVEHRALNNLNLVLRPDWQVNGRLVGLLLLNIVGGGEAGVGLEEGLVLLKEVQVGLLLGSAAWGSGSWTSWTDDHTWILILTFRPWDTSWVCRPYRQCGSSCPPRTGSCSCSPVWRTGCCMCGQRMICIPRRWRPRSGNRRPAPRTPGTAGSEEGRSGPS